MSSASPEYGPAFGERAFAVTEIGFVAVVANEASAFAEPRGGEFGRVGATVGSKQPLLMEPALELAALGSSDPPVAPL